MFGSISMHLLSLSPPEVSLLDFGQHPWKSTFDRTPQLLEVALVAVTETTAEARALRDCAHTSARHLSTQTVVKPWLSFRERQCPYLNSGKMWSCGFRSFVSFIPTSTACWHESKEECWAWQCGSRPLPPLACFLMHQLASRLSCLPVGLQSASLP